ncbi:MAG: hypothetical protein ACPG4T_13355, partial [Nannocystaceae bacterium]
MKQFQRNTAIELRIVGKMHGTDPTLAKAVKQHKSPKTHRFSRSTEQLVCEPLPPTLPSSRRPAGSGSLDFIMRQRRGK